MSTTTFQFTFEVGGVLTDVTSVVLSDPNGLYGAIRNDTSGIVVADGTAMTHASTGVYQYTLTDPDVGLTYTWWAEYVYNGVTNRAQFTTTATTDDPYEGRYTTEAAVNQWEGTFNATVFTDVNADGMRDAGAMQQAIVTAEARVDFATNGPYTFETEDDDVTLTQNGTVAAGMFNRWARWLARVEYWSKRLQDNDSAWQALTGYENKVEQEMERFRSGDANLPGAIPDNAPEDDTTPAAGTFQFIPIDRGVDRRTDEYGRCY